MSARFLTLRQVADELGISPWSVYRPVRLRRLHALRVGRTWRVDVDDVTAYRARKS